MPGRHFTVNSDRRRIPQHWRAIRWWKLDSAAETDVRLALKSDHRTTDRRFCDTTFAQRNVISSVEMSPVAVAHAVLKRNITPG
jgi:hypothetical protein